MIPFGSLARVLSSSSKDLCRVGGPVPGYPYVEILCSHVVSWAKEEELEVLSHSFEPGDRIYIVAPMGRGMLKVDTNDYAKRCHKHCVWPFAPTMSILFGQSGIIMFPPKDGCLFIDHKNGCMAHWAISMVIPEHLRPGPAPVWRPQEENLDDILASLYDNVQGKATGTDTGDLLESYRRMTGKDRPGFMR